MFRMVAGLRSSGKTSLLMKMQAWNYLYDNAEALPQPPPTKHLRRFSFDLGHLETEFVEVPSSSLPMTTQSVQTLINQVDAIIYMIDSSNPIRLQQAQGQLQDLSRIGFSNARLLVLFTKTDSPKSMNNDELIDAMFPDITDANNFAFERITLNSLTRAINVIGEFIKQLPRRI